MSKDQYLKIQTCVLKVNIHCDGCKQKVKKILQKIDGVYTIKIDSEQGKVTVSGNVDPPTLIKKLIKNGKHAEIWGGSKPHNNFQNQVSNQFKNLMIDNGKGGNNKGNVPKGDDDKSKGAGQDQLKLLQQLQQIKGFQDLKPLPLNKDHNQKTGKLGLPEDEDLSDDEFDDDDDYDDDDDDDDDDEDDDDELDEDDEFEEDVEDAPLSKMKPLGGNGNGGSFMSNLLMNNKNLVKGGGDNGENGGGIGKKGGGGENDGGKKGGAQPKDSKNGGGGGGKNNKNDNHGGSGATNGKYFKTNGAMKSGGTNDETQGLPKMMSMDLPISQMGNIPKSHPTVQGLPALNTPSGGGGYFQGRGPENMAGNPYNQQQLAAMMMNQRRANGNETFQPMIYARPPPAVNYMPSYPPYPYPPPPGEHIDQYSMFSDENTSGCNIM
ncbi:keratin, type I cytoskeletal 9 [Dorcoceras hygrometricum]|uniref:Keratin, type I cytoskeletal 9 n=1 Tax=Dorcoceras hygrometricum TaxID=472368 RepID=A0A2Z7B9M4_9LAMI|nr:keratin, type I cytoskeletal 9 [Dorcoceras hygrometricum]